MMSIQESAMTMLQNGQYTELEQICTEHQNQHPMFKLLLAIALGKQQKFDSADALFSQLAQAYPANPDIPFNQAIILVNWDIPAAQRAYQRALTINPRYHPAFHGLGNAFVAQGKLEQAIVEFEKAVELLPNNPIYRRSLANACFQVRQYSSVIKHMMPMMAQFNPEDYALVSHAQYLLDNRQAVFELFNHAQRAGKVDANALFYAALCEIDEKRFVKALNMLKQGLELQPEKQAEFSWKANVAFCKFMLDGNYEVVEGLLEPLKGSERPDDFVFMVNLLEACAKLPEALDICQQGLQKFAHSFELGLSKAKLERRVKNYTSASDSIQTLSPETRGQKKQLIYENIKLNELLGDHPRVVDLIRDAETLYSQGERSDYLTRFCNVIDEADQSLSPVDRLSGQHSEEPKFVFIVGFPRSGTTLVESRLAALPCVKVLEETDAFGSFYRRLSAQAKPLGVIQYLNSLSEDQKHSLRKEYIDSLHDYCHFERKSSTILIDKMPINGVYSAAITGLFPEARILLIERDARDVCLSCLKQSEINLYNERDFSVAYDKYFSLLERLQHEAGCEFLRIKYEEFVADFEQQFTQLCENLGLQRDGEEDQTNGVKLFNTPSYEQVKQPIYKTSVRAYEKYSGELDLSQPLIRKWLTAFGYQD